jgi:hypothetical protein
MPARGWLIRMRLTGVAASVNSDSMCARIDDAILRRFCRGEAEESGSAIESQIVVMQGVITSV